MLKTVLMGHFPSVGIFGGQFPASYSKKFLTMGKTVTTLKTSDVRGEMYIPRLDMFFQGGAKMGVPYIDVGIRSGLR